MSEAEFGSWSGRREVRRPIRFWRGLHRVGGVGAGDADAVVEEGGVDGGDFDLGHVAGDAVGFCLRADFCGLGGR